jgi:hydrogenase expression/formation protein HypD
MRGQGVADQHVDDPGAPEGGRQHHDARVLGPDLADTGRVASQRMGPQRGESGVPRGVIKPWECKVFGTACTPETPIGTCMVSSEGACAAYDNSAGSTTRPP